MGSVLSGFERVKGTLVRGLYHAADRGIDVRYGSAGGKEAMIERYGELRDRYYGSGSYDFRRASATRRGPGGKYRRAILDPATGVHPEAGLRAVIPAAAP